jgi:hypothetical protein
VASTFRLLNSSSGILFIQSQLSKLSKENSIVFIPLIPYRSVPLPLSYRTVPQYPLIHDHLIIRVYLIDPSRCRDLSLGLIPSYSCRGRDILWMVIFGICFFPFRRWRHDWFSAELPSIVVHATASTLTLFESFFYQVGAIPSRTFFLSVWTGVWPVVWSSFLGCLEPYFPPDPRSLGVSSLWSPSWGFLLLSFFSRPEELSFEECFYCSIRNSSIPSPTLQSLSA